MAALVGSKRSFTITRPDGSSFRPAILHIHIPKCGGNSVALALHNGFVTEEIEWRTRKRTHKRGGRYTTKVFTPFRGHNPYYLMAARWKEKLASWSLDGTTSLVLCAVRNPWARMASWYEHLRLNNSVKFGKDLEPVADLIKLDKLSFDDFVAMWCSSADLPQNGYLPQHHYFTVEPAGTGAGATADRNLLDIDNIDKELTDALCAFGVKPEQLPAIPLLRLNSREANSEKPFRYSHHTTGLLVSKFQDYREYYSKSSTIATVGSFESRIIKIKGYSFE